MEQILADSKILVPAYKHKLYNNAKLVIGDAIYTDTKEILYYNQVQLARGLEDKKPQIFTIVTDADTKAYPIDGVCYQNYVMFILLNVFNTLKISDIIKDNYSVFTVIDCNEQYVLCTPNIYSFYSSLETRNNYGITIKDVLLWKNQQTLLDCI